MQEEDVFTQVGVVGAGFMGSGIAESVARAGIPVVLYEPEEAPLRRSGERIDASLERAVAGGKLDADDAGALRDRIRWTTDLEAIDGSDIVIEAIVEDPRNLPASTPSKIEYTFACS